MKSTRPLLKLALALMSPCVAFLPQSSSAQNEQSTNNEAIELHTLERTQQKLWAMISTKPIEAKLQIGNKTQTVKGQVGFNFETSPELLKLGQVKVEDLNLALFGVDQTQISGRRFNSKPTGILGFSILNKAESKALLKYEPQSLSLQGEIPVNMHFPQVDEIVPQRERKEDFYVSPKIPASVAIEFKLDQPLEKLLMEEPQKLLLSGKLSLLFKGSALGDSKLQAINTQYEFNQSVVELVPLFRYEIARKLCLQPVRIRAATTDASTTGAGLAFGLTQANAEWAKTDIVFEIRPWKTITNASLKIVDNATEESQIRASVQDDDCIEVFFIENFNPEDTHGGGATWASGTASAQIISSDGNATGGIDFTHLAHELGHVLALGHPSGSTGLVSGNTGTLMCPSGWHHDNPTKNSLGNKYHQGNPLLRFAIKARSVGPDCTANADCGPCT